VTLRRRLVVILTALAATAMLALAFHDRRPPPPSFGVAGEAAGRPGGLARCRALGEAALRDGGRRQAWRFARERLLEGAAP
jgi:conjugative transfer region protein TrbK